MVQQNEESLQSEARVLLGWPPKNAELRAKWNRIDCDVVMRGSFMSCEARNGWDLVKHWRNESQHVNTYVLKGKSKKETCVAGLVKGSYQCSMYDLALDFKRVDKLQAFQDNPRLNVRNIKRV